MSRNLNPDINSKNTVKINNEELLITLLWEFILNNFYFFLCLIAIVVVSGLLVTQVHETRASNTLISREKKIQDSYDKEYQHLMLERQTLTEDFYVREQVTKKLKMSDLSVENKRVIDLRNSAGGSK